MGELVGFVRAEGGREERRRVEEVVVKIGGLETARMARRRARRVVRRGCFLGLLDVKGIEEGRGGTYNG